MATIYCNLNTGSGLKKLNEYLLHRSYSTRYHLNSKRSSSFLCNSKKHFHTTYRRKLKIEKGHQSQQVGSAAAYFQTGIFSARRYFVLLASSVLIITWLNLSNDIYDFDTGADKNKRESVVNLAGSRTVTLLAAYSFLALGFMGLTWTSMGAGNMRSIISLACAIFFGYIYQV
ncbi:hypothetical protein RGQ29_006154 [Quercus rubra]|uniref:Uncharacterized protein n=1 Tax=Quercus rubra TaxID=3512 RepID=A0AAN7E6J3_QUERU|nr:hypothetical protein RGQ29_006154 [Quercus rubra]